MMAEIVKHINDTNASYRAPNAGDAKNTDLFLDNEHYELFRDFGEQIAVRFNKKNLTQAILFIASILPRKYDNSSIHKMIPFSKRFVLEQLELLDGFFVVDGVTVENKTQIWNARKDVPQKNGKIDNRFYFNGLLEGFSYKDAHGLIQRAKFTIRNYLAGGYSDIHIKKGDDDIFDVWITNTLEPYDDGKEKDFEDIEAVRSTKKSLQQIFYGAPGTGKSFKIKKEVEDAGMIYFRTTFHPDSDYSTFVGCYKPTMDKGLDASDFVGMTRDGEYNMPRTKGNIIYSFTPQAFTNAYVKAWQTEKPVFLIIEEINRGNCAQIFGDLFQLLDRDENGYSQYKVDADTDLADYIREHLANEHRDGTPDFIYAEKDLKLQLPNNLYIWATMNTSDQSLFPIDSAFKRRWEWVYSPIAEGKEKDGSKALWQIEGQGEDSWWKFIQGINEVIDVTTHSEDKKLGYYFCKPTLMIDGCQYPKIITKNTFVNKVVFYLWNDVFKVYGFRSEIFDIKEENSTSQKITFKSFYKDDGSVNDAIVNMFVNNVMAKAPKSTSSEDEQQDERNETEQTAEA